jgi:hypothetical protein
MFIFGDSGLELLLLKKNEDLGTIRWFFNKTNQNTQTNLADTREKFGSLVLQRSSPAAADTCPICLSDCSFFDFFKLYLRKNGK